jgi:hypothetical protein
MIESAAHFSRTNSGEHPPNGVQTEFKYQGEIELIEKNIASWHEQERLDCLFLKALLRLANNHSDQVDKGFTAWVLVETISSIKNRPWSTLGNIERMSDDVRRTWKSFEKLWQSKSEGIIQSLQDAGLTHYPKFKRVEGGGTGNLTKFYIEWCKLADLAALNPQVKIDIRPHDGTTHIKYICEDIQDASLLAKVFAKGLLLNGWRRIFYIAALLIPLLIMLFISLIFVINVAFFNSPGKNHLGGFFSSLIIFFSIYISIYPMINLRTKGILLAPWWMQSVEEERLLEFRRPPRFEGRSIKAVSYTSTCTFCQSKVTAKSGGIEFFGRIIGRCEESPVEHVFSFDHVTRQGKWLRK